jgi:transposase
VRDATFDACDLSAFCRLDELGLVVVGQCVEADHAELACRVVDTDRWCRRCGGAGVARDSVVRRLAHEPFGWRPTALAVTVRRYRCNDCAHVWRQDMCAAAEPRAKISRGGLRWALVAIVCQHLTVARVAEGLGVSWNCANTAVLEEGRRVLIADPGRFDGVRVIGVDEHVWRHTRRGPRFVTVIIDLTAVRDGTGPARLLDMVEGRSKHAGQIRGGRHAERRGLRLAVTRQPSRVKKRAPNAVDLADGLGSWAWRAHRTRRTRVAPGSVPAMFRTATAREASELVGDGGGFLVDDRLVDQPGRMLGQR